MADAPAPLPADRNATTVMSKHRKFKWLRWLLVAVVLAVVAGLFYGRIQKSRVAQLAANTVSGNVTETAAPETAQTDAPTSAAPQNAPPEGYIRLPATEPAPEGLVLVHIDKRGCTKKGDIRAVAEGNVPVTYYKRSCVKLEYVAK